MEISIKKFLTFLLLLFVLTGCAREFEPYWKIDKLRLMAIGADPIVAMPGEPVTISALVYAPDDQQIRYHWSWCPVLVSAQDDYECPIPPEELGDMAQFLDLGEDPTATFINPFSAEEVRDFCEQITRTILEELDDPELARLLPVNDCEQGYEISLRLVVETDDDSIVATKRMTLWGGGEQYNQNPRFADFQVRPADPDDLDRLRTRAGWTVAAGADHDDQWLSITEDNPLSILTDIPMEMRSLIDAESVLTYTPPAPHGQESQIPEPRQEAMVIRYFTTAGSISGSRQLFAPPDNTIEEATISQFSISSDDIDQGCQSFAEEGCGVRLWSVVRDARLGVAWVEGYLSVVE